MNKEYIFKKVVENKMRHIEFENTLYNFLVTHKTGDDIIKKESFALLQLDSPNSHIRVDRFFSEENRLFPFAHYTTTNKGKKIHVGFYNDGSIEPFPDSLGLVTKKIADEAIAARSQIDLLMKDFSDYVSQLEKRYITTEAALCYAKTQEERSDYYQKCVAILEEKSCLLQVEDPRLNLLVSQERYFKIQPIASSKQHTTCGHEEEAALSTPKDEAVAQAVEATLDQAQDDFEAECKKLLKKLAKSRKNLLKFNTIIQHIEALISLHSITACLSSETLANAKLAMNKKVPNIEIIIDRVRLNDFKNAYIYALQEEPLQVIRDLSLNKTLTARQKLTFLKHICAKSPIYSYIISSGAFSHNKVNFDPIIICYQILTPPSPEKKELIAFLANMLRLNTVIINHTHVPFLSAMIYYTRCDIFTIKEAIEIMEIMLKKPQYQHQSEAKLSIIQHTSKEKAKIISMREKAEETLYVEYLYFAFPKDEKYLNTRIFDLIISRGNLPELILFLLNIAFFNKRINMRSAIGCSAKNHSGLAVGNDKVSMFKKGDGFRSASLFSDIKPSPITVYGIEQTTQRINDILFSGDTSHQLKLLNTAFARITDIGKKSKTIYQSETFFSRAKTLCAQIALTVIPKAHPEIQQWAERIQKSLVETVLKAQYEQLTILIEHILIKFISVRQPISSFTESHLKRLRLLLASSLSKQKPELAEHLLSKILILFPSAAPQQDELNVLSEIAQEHGILVTFK